MQKFRVRVRQAEKCQLAGNGGAFPMCERNTEANGCTGGIAHEHIRKEVLARAHAEVAGNGRNYGCANPCESFHCSV